MEEGEIKQKHQLEEINKKEAQNILKLYPHKFNPKSFKMFLENKDSKNGVKHHNIISNDQFTKYIISFLATGIFSVSTYIVAQEILNSSSGLVNIYKHSLSGYLLAGIINCGIFGFSSINLHKSSKECRIKYEETLLKWDDLDWIEYQSKLLNRDEKLNLMKVIKSEFEKNQKQKKRKEIVKTFKNKFTIFSS